MLYLPRLSESDDSTPADKSSMVAVFDNATVIEPWLAPPTSALTCKQTIPSHFLTRANTLCKKTFRKVCSFTYHVGIGYEPGRCLKWHCTSP